MVAYIQPVTHLASVAVDRNLFAFQGIVDHRRNQLFGVLVWAIVVGTVGGNSRQAVGVMVGAEQVVGRSFARRIGAVWRVTVGFGKGRRFVFEGAIHFISRHMQQTECIPLVIGQAPQ